MSVEQYCYDKFSHYFFCRLVLKISGSLVRLVSAGFFAVLGLVSANVIIHFLKKWLITHAKCLVS